jgi:hypothetical protein
MGTLFCQYETPCGICTRTNNPCTERGCKKPKSSLMTPAEILDGSKEVKPDESIRPNDRS